MRADRARIAALFALSIAAAAIPIFSCRFPSIADYPNHLARVDVLLRFRHEPALAEFFRPDWRAVPNLAFDLWTLAFAQVLPIEAAGKLFLVATLALLLSGVVFLHRATFGRWSYWPFLALVLLYNRLLLVGLINFLFGVGLWLHALALWVHLRPRSALVRGPALSAAALAVFFAHLFAFGLLAVTIAVYELVIFWSDKRPWPKRIGDLIAGAVPFLPALAIFAFLTPRGDADAIVRYRDLWTRLEAFGAPVLYDWRIDAAFLLILLALVAWMAAARAIDLNRPLAAGAIVLFALQFCMPDAVMTAQGADHRIPIPLALLAIAAADPKSASRAQRLCLASAVAVFFVLRLAVVEAHWSRAQPVYAEALAGLSSLPAGARVATATPPHSFDDFSAPTIALYHLPVWAVVSRGGFTQTLFAFPTQQPLILTQKYAALAAATPAGAIWRAFVVVGGNPECRAGPALVAALREYGYVGFVSAAKFTVCRASLLQPVYSGRYVQVFRVAPGP